MRNDPVTGLRGYDSVVPLEGEGGEGGAA